MSCIDVLVLIHLPTCYVAIKRHKWSTGFGELLKKPRFPKKRVLNLQQEKLILSNCNAALLLFHTAHQVPNTLMPTHFMV
jgi:hypothetical protein